MTVQNQFYNYQDNPAGYEWDKDPWNSCQPVVNSMVAYLVSLGMTRLGCHVDRSVTGTTNRVSTHAFGMAPDVGFPASMLDEVRNKIIPFLIATSKETGLQAIHDYRSSSIWRPPGTSGRGANGWKKQKASSGGMGQSWANWLHLEFHPSMRTDGRSISDKVRSTVIPPVGIKPPPAPPVNEVPQAITPGVKTVIKVEVTTIRKGSKGGRVKKLQALLNANFMGPGQKSLLEDGIFGPATENKVEEVQIFFGLVKDGICGPITWGIVENYPE